MSIENKDKKTYIKEGEDSPGVLLDLEKCQIIIEGPSFPEDAVDFYQPIINWIKKNENNLDSLVCMFDFTILSSASSKMVFEILIKLENLSLKGKNIAVKWYYSSYDEDMFEEGNGFRDNLKVPFEIIEK